MKCDESYEANNKRYVEKGGKRKQKGLSLITRNGHVICLSVCPDYSESQVNDKYVIYIHIYVYI